MKQFFYQGIFWRGLNYISVFIVTIVIARLFKPGESGSINYLINNLAILILVSSFSLESALGYFSAKSSVPHAAIVATTLMMVLLSTLINLAVIRWIIVPAGGASVQIFCTAYCTGVILMNYFSGLFFSHFNYIVSNIVVMLVNAGIIAICLLASSWVTGINAEHFIPVYFLSFLFAGIFIAAAYLAKYGLAFRLPSLQQLIDIFRYAGLALVANLVFFLVYRVDYWFVHRNCSADELGNYIQVSKLGQIFMLLPGILAGVLFTRTAKSNEPGDVMLLQALSRLLLLFYCTVLAILVVAGRWLFPFVYGEGFEKMYIPFLLLVPGIVSLSTLTLVTAFNAAHQRLAMNVQGAVIALLVIVLGNLIFSARYGIYAASVISSIGYICYQVFIMIRIRKYTPGARTRDFFLPSPGDLQLIKNTLKFHEKN